MRVCYADILDDLFNHKFCLPVGTRYILSNRQALGIDDSARVAVDSCRGAKYKLCNIMR
ncbi:hypothetical protein D3C85_1795140 [compost metagenome]